MATQSAEQARDLTGAFQAFSAISQQLVDAYSVLEKQVADLTQELAAARGERLRQLAEKERLANRLQTLLAALPAGVIVLDAETRVCECNLAACTILGEPLMGEVWATVVARCVERTSEPGHDVVLKNGRMLSVSSCALESEPGQIILLQDVTENRSLQSTVDHQRRLSLMGEMVASLAHQVRTPIAAALLYANNLSTPHLRPEDRERFCAKIVGRLQHLDCIVGDMLLFAKNELKREDSVALSVLLADLVAAMAPVVSAHAATLHIEPPRCDIHLLVNRTALQSVFQNLILNALQAGTGGIAVELRSYFEPGRLRITIDDNGPGVPPEVRHRIFDPFFTTRSNGTGLGLSVARSVLRAHEGDLALHSSSPRGTTFVVSLPLLRTETSLTSSLATATSHSDSEANRLAGAGHRKRRAERQADRASTL